MMTAANENFQLIWWCNLPIQMANYVENVVRSFHIHLADDGPGSTARPSRTGTMWSNLPAAGAISP